MTMEMLSLLLLSLERNHVNSKLIEPFASKEVMTHSTTWVNLEICTLSELSQRKTNTV